jgi:hypothetical protein
VGKFEVFATSRTEENDEEVRLMAETIGGVVINGVVVPDEQLPEGARVSIALQAEPQEFSADERAEFQAWNRASDKALALVDGRTNGGTSMNDTISTSPMITIAPDVGPVLQKGAAESKFAVILELIRNCFPQILSMNVFLQEDWCEPSSIRIVIEILLESHSDDREKESQQWREFNQQLVSQVALDHLLLFLVRPRYPAR